MTACIYTEGVKGGGDAGIGGIAGTSEERDDLVEFV